MCVVGMVPHYFKLSVSRRSTYIRFSHCLRIIELSNGRITNDYKLVERVINSPRTD